MSLSFPPLMKPISKTQTSSPLPVKMNKEGSTKRCRSSALNADINSSRDEAEATIGFLLAPMCAVRVPAVALLQENSGGETGQNRSLGRREIHRRNHIRRRTSGTQECGL